MNVDECLFCKMAAGQISVTKIYEDDIVLSFLDIGPISNGHTLVIPKQHCEKLHTCPPYLLAQIASRIGKIAHALVDALNVDGYNVLCNNGKVAGQHINHLHFHIIPRRAGDDVFERLPAFKYKEGQIEKLAEQIRKKL
jgi:histidine triad (HIT) family protein